MTRARTLAAALIAALFCAGCTTPLRTGLAEHEANHILLALDDHAIAASKEPEASASTFRVLVAESDATRALRVLDEVGALRPSVPGAATLLGEASLVPTPSEEAERWSRATANEVARSIEELDGVLEARVHIAPARVGATLGAEPKAARASVLVRRAHGTPELAAAAVRALVVGATEGLAASDVQVVQTEAKPSTIHARFARLGPWTVARESALSLRAVLAAGLALHALLAVAVIALVTRARRMRRASNR